MKKKINELINVDKHVLVFLIIICIIGITTGSIFMTVLSTKDKETIIYSLNSFITNIGHINTKYELINNLIINISYILIIWILGISIIGIPIVIILLFFKSYILSFTISSFIFQYKTKGILLASIYTMPHLIINLVIYLYLGVYSIKLSSYIIKCITKKKIIDFKYIINRYIQVLIISIVMIIITTLYQSFIVPIILEKVIALIKL